MPVKIEVTSEIIDLVADAARTSAAAKQAYLLIRAEADNEIPTLDATWRMLDARQVGSK